MGVDVYTVERHVPCASNETNGCGRGNTDGHVHPWIKTIVMPMQHNAKEDARMESDESRTTNFFTTQGGAW